MEGETLISSSLGFSEILGKPLELLEDLGLLSKKKPRTGWWPGIGPADAALNRKTREGQELDDLPFLQANAIAMQCNFRQRQIVF